MNYLAVESLIIDRLTAEVPALRAVLSADALTDLTEGVQTTPAAYVLYDGDDVPSTDGKRAGDGARQLVSQRWLVVLAVRNARGGADAREDAGPLLTQILAALAGYHPQPAPPAQVYRPLKRAQAPRPGYHAGYGYFPLLFTTEVLT